MPSALIRATPLDSRGFFVIPRSAETMTQSLSSERSWIQAGSGMSAGNLSRRCVAWCSSTPRSSSATARARYGDIWLSKRTSRGDEGLFIFHCMVHRTLTDVIPLRDARVRAFNVIGPGQDAGRHALAWDDRLSEAPLWIQDDQLVLAKRPPFASLSILVEFQADHEARHEAFERRLVANEIQERAVRFCSRRHVIEDVAAVRLESAP